MCHIKTWSTKYCMRTAEKVWRSKVKKYGLSSVKNDTRQITALPSVKKRHSANHHFAECQKKTLGKGLTAAALCRVSGE